MSNGDINSDGIVHSSDITHLINNWNNPYTFTDLNNILANWEPQPEPEPEPEPQPEPEPEPEPQPEPEPEPEPQPEPEPEPEPQPEPEPEPEPQPEPEPEPEGEPQFTIQRYNQQSGNFYNNTVPETLSQNIDEMAHDMNNGDHNLDNIYMVVPDNHPAGETVFDNIILSSDSGGVITWPLNDGTRYADTQNATGYTGKRLKVNLSNTSNVVGGGVTNNMYSGTATFSFTYNGVTTLQSLNYSFDFDE